MAKTVGPGDVPLPPKLEALTGYTDEELRSIIFAHPDMGKALKNAEVAQAFMDRLRCVGDAVAARLSKEIKVAERDYLSAKFRMLSIRRRLKKAKAKKKQPDWVTERFGRIEKVKRKLTKRYNKLLAAKRAMT